MLKIGNLKLKSRLILAPMAGISDFPYRMINRKFGCELAFTEMINCRALGYNSKKTKQMLYSGPKDRPLGVQLLGSRPEFILRALDILKAYKFDLLDFNAACPVNKVVKRGEGAALLKHPKELNQLLKIIVKELEVPVTVKLRIGWDSSCVDLKELAFACQDSGISAVFIHGRTKHQGYSGEVDYEAIKKFKGHIKIPVIASGNIFSGQLAKKMFDQTGVDALLIARGALGNPWLFKEIAEFLKNGKMIKPPKIKEKVNTIIEHLTMCIEFYGEKMGVIIFRKFLIWYTKGLRNIRPLRKLISYTGNKDSTINLIRRCFEG